MTGGTGRTLDIPLTFLGNGEYTAKVYSDGSNAKKEPKQVDIKKFKVTSKDIIKVEMAAGGGNVVHIHK